MAKNIAIKNRPAPISVQPVVTAKNNAIQDRNWSVLAICSVFVASLLASLATIVASIQANVTLALVALIMVLVQGWLIFGLLHYSKLSLWAGLTFIVCFWFFALPCLLLNVLPPMFNAFGTVLLAVSLLPFFLLIWQRRRFSK